MIVRTLFKLTSMACLAITVALFASGETKAQQGYVVQFRLPEGRSAHFEDSRSAEKVSQTMMRLGCEVRRQNHGDHMDIAYRCPQWRTIDVASDAEAHRWQTWLKNQGFETAHRH